MAYLTNSKFKSRQCCDLYIFVQSYWRWYLNFSVTSIAFVPSGFQVIHWCSCIIYIIIRATKCCESRWTASVRWIQLTMFVTSDIVIISHACNLRSAIILTRTLRWDNLSIARIGRFSWHKYAISLVRNQRISLFFWFCRSYSCHRGWGRQNFTKSVNASFINRTIRINITFSWNSTRTITEAYSTLSAWSSTGSVAFWSSYCTMLFASSICLTIKHLITRSSTCSISCLAEYCAAVSNCWSHCWGNWWYCCCYCPSWKC